MIHFSFGIFPLGNMLTFDYRIEISNKKVVINL